MVSREAIDEFVYPASTYQSIPRQLQVAKNARVDGLRGLGKSLVLDGGAGERPHDCADARADDEIGLEPRGAKLLYDADMREAAHGAARQDERPLDR